MTNEKRIEEAAKAIYETRDDAYDLDAWEQLDRTQQERYVCDARTALAVFEKALGEVTVTPTDDEREALAQIIRDTDRDAPNPWSQGMADAILTAGFRRSVVPEPRGDAYELTVDMLEDLLVTAGVTPGEHGTAIRKTAGALVYKIRARLTSEPQGEPSDAKVAAAGRELFDRARPGNEHADLTYEEVRGEYEADAHAALRAAGVGGAR